MLSVDGCIKSVKIYKNLEKLYKKSWLFINRYMIWRHQSFVCTQFKCQTVLFDPLIGPFQVLPLQVRVHLGSNGYEEVLYIAQSSSITRALPSDCLISYPGHLLGREGELPLCRDVVYVFYIPSQLGCIYILCVNQFFQSKWRWSGKVEPQL